MPDLLTSGYVNTDKAFRKDCWGYKIFRYNFLNI